MTTGDELLLLAIVPGRQRIRIRSDNRLRYALRTSELADLCLAGRIAVGRRRIEVLDTRPVEDRRLSNVLQGLGAATPPPGLKDWLRRTPRSLIVEYLSRLEDQKAVRPSVARFQRPYPQRHSFRGHAAPPGATDPPRQRGPRRLRNVHR
ncbi:GOLPH3/VPS74 family protein [Streptomyces sp. NPDC002666]